tara:strand:+ start:193 stop:666 length:474 start_codon:yes stop_codon:yes gene_type:complete
MYKLFLIFLSSFFFYACTNKALSTDKIKIDLKELSFDVVEKKLELHGTIPTYVKDLANFWFNNKVKVNGIDGILFFTLSDYNEKVSDIVDGKRIDISLKFQVLTYNSNMSKKIKIIGEVNTFGTIDGDFALNEFDNLIKKTQSDLIVRLSKDLKSNI